MAELLYALPDGVVVKGRKSKVVPLCLTLAGVVLLVVNGLLPATAGYEDLKSALVLFGGVIFATGVLLLLVRLFGDSGVPLYGENRVPLVWSERYYPKSAASAVADCLTRHDWARLRSIAQSQVPAIRLVAYHTPDEVRALLSRLFGYEIDPSVRVFPPFYTDFGRNIAVGKGVFINACCHFQDHGGVTLGDGCQIGHNVVFATLDHGIAPAERRTTVPAPIVLGRNVWVGSNATILRGVTIGDNAVVAAGAVVAKDVEANTIVGGVPARLLRRIDG